ncbi:MAG TPA: hypothetical protein DCZ01_08375 [Elusimicrobia bacterium]|nr:MAG: hypothetical protein A2X37_10360 [Elusimicrobia bacterium GWA2_66_18]HAZ08518.1 hypothetical protein [Elusimicrobiota bacterium]
MVFSGDVDQLAWSPGALLLTESACARIGAVIGLVSWFGMGDMHRQNIAFGTLGDGRPVCAPVDIECLFFDYKLPAQSRLIGYPDEAGRRCGLAGFQELLDEAGRPAGFVAATLHGYIGVMLALTRHEHSVSSTLIAEPGILGWPIRVILRDTAAYRSVLDSVILPDTLRPGLLPSEMSQLSRGDVPYFFREAASLEQRWLEKNSRDWTGASAPVSPDPSEFPALEIIRELGADGRIAWRHRETLLGAGTLQIARMLSGVGRGEASYAGASLSVTDQHIAVSWGEDQRHRWACAR